MDDSKSITILQINFLEFTTEMLKIVCGENTVASREYFSSLKKELKKKGYSVIELAADNFFSKISDVRENMMLFSEKKVFFAENIYKRLSKKKEFKKILKEFESDKSNNLVIWEELSAREISGVDKKSIIEFKFPENIFKLLDSFYLGNFPQFHSLLMRISERVPEYLIFYLLIKRVHQLLLISLGESVNLPEWQKTRLKRQAKLWTLDKLLKAVEGLYKIDLRLKTSSTPFSLVDSLDILAGVIL